MPTGVRTSAGALVRRSGMIPEYLGAVRKASRQSRWSERGWHQWNAISTRFLPHRRTRNG